MALNRVAVNLFRRDTGSMQGRLIVFWSVSLLISRTKTSIYQFPEANGFLRAKLMENRELRGAQNAKDIYPCIFFIVKIRYPCPYPYSNILRKALVILKMRN